MVSLPDQRLKKLASTPPQLCLIEILIRYSFKDLMADKESKQMDNSSMPSSGKEEEVVKSKYGGIVPKKPPLISKDHERAYFDSADWALGKQGAAKPKGPLEALRPKLQPTQQQTRYRKSPYAPADGEDASTPSSDATADD
ncbi:hypothetical protein L1887_22470 [Cichorium endivia]|nr:hypothetical protein L1887_22470 [Cichorium endivia]